MTSPRHTEGATEAPANSLPDWGECAQRVENSDFLAKRVAEGGYGPEADSKLATQLHRFIYEYDDADRYRSAWFLHRLELLLEETRRDARSAIPPEPAAEVKADAGWLPISTAPKDGVLSLFCDMQAKQLRDTFFVDWMVKGAFCGDRRRSATHWMPLPDYPAPNQGAES